MRITNLELKFSKIGINTLSQARKECYMPVVVIKYENQPKKKRIYLDDYISDKKSVKHLIAGETYISLLINEEFLSMIWRDVNKVLSLPKIMAS